MTRAHSMPCFYCGDDAVDGGACLGLQRDLRGEVVNLFFCNEICYQRWNEFDAKAAVAADCRGQEACYAKAFSCAYHSLKNAHFALYRERYETTDCVVKPNIDACRKCGAAISAGAEFLGIKMDGHFRAYCSRWCYSRDLEGSVAPSKSEGSPPRKSARQLVDERAARDGLKLAELIGRLYATSKRLDDIDPQSDLPEEDRE